MVKAVDCGIVESEFELQSRYYTHFRTNNLRKGMNPLILPAMGSIVPLSFFLKEGFGIKLPKEVDLPSNKETKSFIYTVKWLKKLLYITNNSI